MCRWKLTLPQTLLEERRLTNTQIYFKSKILIEILLHHSLLMSDRIHQKLYFIIETLRKNFFLTITPSLSLEQNLDS